MSVALKWHQQQAREEKELKFYLQGLQNASVKIQEKTKTPHLRAEMLMTVEQMLSRKPNIEPVPLAVRRAFETLKIARAKWTAITSIENEPSLDSCRQALGQIQYRMSEAERLNEEVEKWEEVLQREKISTANHTVVNTELRPTSKAPKCLSLIHI